MSDPIVCPYRWDTGDNTDPGWCQCQRGANHDGAHQCCCGATNPPYCVRCGIPHNGEMTCGREAK